MKKYYTRVCNFYYGSESKLKVKKKNSLPLNGNHNISFDFIEIITRKFKKKIHIKEIKNQNKNLRKKINKDLKVEDDKSSSALGSIGLKPKIVH